ncbi:MAG: DMT family transporter [Deltaproteobacteria bacterium]|nr:DMT family transporter [Deltaproteobacteria bacterium]
MKGQITGLLAIFVAASIWGLGGPYFRWVDSQGVSIFTSNAISGIVAAPIMLALALARGRSVRIAPGRLPVLVLMALATMATNYTMFHAFRVTTVANTVLLHYMTPVFVALVAVPLFGERLTWLKLVALFASMMGMMLVVSSGPGGVALSIGRGEILAFLSSLSYTVSIVAGRHLRGIDPGVSAFWLNVLLAVFSAAAAVPGFHPPPLVAVGVIAVGGGLIGSCLTILLYFFALSRADASRVSIVALMEVVVGAAVGIALFGEPATWNVFAGGALILGGCIVVAAEKNAHDPQ